MTAIFAQTLLPIFAIIALGYLLKAKRLLVPDVNRAINRVVFYVAIPAMLVTKLAPMSFARSFDGAGLLAASLALVLVWLLARGVGGRFIADRGRCATFVQNCIHGNLGYMGYAVAYYALSEEAFAQAAVLGGFIMIEQNVLAVLAYTTSGRADGRDRHAPALFRPILQNPVILAVLSGLALSLSGFTLPLPVFRTLSILAGMSFPTALLLIGAGLAFTETRSAGRELLGIGCCKLVLLPLLGWLLLAALGAPAGVWLPALILLASPPATVTYVYAIGMNGDIDLAAASISLHTLLSALAYSVLFFFFAVP